MKNDLIEVLSPAGSFESLKAAISAGADAVYLGGDQFGARAYASNFPYEEMIRAIDYAHLHGKKIFMTINTLFKQEEYKKLYDYLLPYYEEGLDAVIVQDVGVARLIRQVFPDLDLHASTQMTVTGVEGAKFLEELGFTRVVPARELSLEEIREIRQETNLEIETFVHGALCYSYSGQCLMSSMLGGRSGNRGRCAQPCRLPYELYRGNQKLNQKEETYLLSPKDLCSIEILPEILEAGTNSLKIEGRMKRPEYVAAVTRQYRAYVDKYVQKKNTKVSEEDKQELMELYNRGGFTKGYYLTHNGRSMMSMKRPNHMGYYVGKIDQIQKNKVLFRCKTDIHKQDVLEIRVGKDQKVELTSPLDVKKGKMVSLNGNQIRKLRPGMEIYRTRNQKLITSIVEDTMKEEKKENIKGIVTFSVGKSVMMQVWNEKFSVQVTGDEVQQAQKQPVTADKIKSQIEKTGDTPFFFDSLEVKVEGEGFLPMGSLKALRRNALEQMEHAIIDGGKRQKVDLKEPNVIEETTSDRNEVIVEALTIEQAEAALETKEVRAIYMFGETIPFEEWETFTERCHKAGKEIYYSFPYVFHKNAKDHWKAQRTLLCEGGHDGLIVRTMDEYAMMRGFSEYKKRLVLDSSLYAYQENAFSFYKEHVSCEVRRILPVELNARELKQLQAKDADMVVYGHQPLMISAQCQRKNQEGCSHQPEWLRLKDRYKKDFPVRNFCQYCYNVIYNGQALNLTKEKELEEIRPNGRIYRFTVENKKEALQILSGTYSKNNYTKGHFKRGIE